MSITIYGASDDLIEVEGDIREEFTYSPYDDSCIVTSCGLVLHANYDGVWKIHVVTNPAGVEVTTVPAVSEDDPNYSDRVTVHADVDWVATTTYLARRRGLKR